MGYGFLEKVYENALCVELQNENMKFLQQSSVQVFYDKNIVGDFVFDLIVEEKIIVEVKAITAKQERTRCAASELSESN